ncbi:Cell surface superoxide dismutase [Cu-Zn] 4 [Conoideocrella luteorostrata]|uniref:superoxide dismutase n=1 Tax=Conoideocrella luteorostrata TaxID=1105319 RepID=A0AAJ0CJ97_9HYPO|nr:Cell surface superoxide dismutase [Cu-Zn] 4 [Conoideocrella luteorostrata]
MRGPALFTVLAAGHAAIAAESALVITGNPIDVIYTASLPEKPFFDASGLDGNIRGFISASAPPDGVGVRFTVRFENLPKTGGPFPYHLHVNKATDGNCTAAGTHIDPTNRGEKPPCNASDDTSCQVGDLAGKHGKIDSDPFLAEFVDKFASLKEDDPSFFGNRSFVIHFSNSTRITCADFVKDGLSIPGPPTGRNFTSAISANVTSATMTASTLFTPSSTIAVSTSTETPVGGIGNGCVGDCTTRLVPSPTTIPSQAVTAAAGTVMAGSLMRSAAVAIVLVVGVSL